MDRRSIAAANRQAVAEAVYRAILTFLALFLCFTQLPDRYAPLGAVAVLLVAAGVRAIIANQDRLSQIEHRRTWLEQLAGRFAAVRLHNMALRHEAAEETWDGGLPVWEDAYRAAVDDVKRYDIDEGGMSAATNPNAKGWGFAAFALQLLGDLVSVGVAAGLASLA